MDMASASRDLPRRVQVTCRDGEAMFDYHNNIFFLGEVVSFMCLCPTVSVILPRDELNRKQLICVAKRRGLASRSSD
jgi:hypothetical protein